VIAYHRVSADRFTALASGLGGPGAVCELAAAQSSKRRLLLRHLLHALPVDDAAPAAATLIRADQSDRQVVAELMSDPLVGAWIMQTVRGLTNGAEASAQPHLAQLGALAAVAALRTGQDATLAAWALDGRLTLPSLGTAMIGSDGPVVIDVIGESVTISGATGSVRNADGDPRWLPLRRFSARHDDVVATVAVEDGNPYRDCYHAPPAQRLSGTEFRRWQELFSEASSLLMRHLPLRAVELCAGLRSVTPLATQDGDMARSGTSRDTFGALGLTRPRSATDFAVTLVHEFQHSKLSGLLDMVPLTVPDGTERHFAPWRSDPRPTAGLFQGVYAFLGIADTWLGLRAVPGLEDEAAREFAMIRRQVDAGLTALERSTELTGKGREFVTQLRATADRMMAETVPPAAAERAVAALNESRRAWEVRNRVSAH
jgi:uncharacterized protein